jgi:hypothetical protein
MLAPVAAAGFFGCSHLSPDGGGFTRAAPPLGSRWLRFGSGRVPVPWPKPPVARRWRGVSGPHHRLASGGYDSQRALAGSSGVANRGIGRYQASVAAGPDASKQGSESVPGTRGLDRCQAPAGERSDASKQGAGSGARHPLWGGRMLANRGLDLVPS